jgi:hypothetical protein
MYEVGDAGTVTVTSDGSALSIVAVDAAAGWAAEVEVATGREVEADFRNGTRRIQFNAELEDGQIKVRVRERADDGGGSTTTTSPTDTTSPTSTTMPTSTTSSTSTTAPPAGDDRGAAVTYEAGDGGAVTISSAGAVLTVVSVDPATGWSTEIEVSSGREVEVDFRNGTRRIQFYAELEDGEVRIRVRDRMDDGGSDSDDGDDSDDRSGSDDDVSDDDDSDDRRGHDDDDDDDDNSGPGSSDDDDNDDDD